MNETGVGMFNHCAKKLNVDMFDQADKVIRTIMVVVFVAVGIFYIIQYLR